MTLDVRKAEVSRSKVVTSDTIGDFAGLTELRSKSDVLVEVAFKLESARSTALDSCDRAIVYFIDMAMLQVCESLSSKTDPDDSGDMQSN